MTLAARLALFAVAIAPVALVYACAERGAGPAPVAPTTSLEIPTAATAQPMPSPYAAPSVSSSREEEEPSAQLFGSGGGIGDAFGAGGLGLSGVGLVGVGGDGGAGIGLGSGSGMGHGTGRLGSNYSTKPPTLRAGTVAVNGKLPPEVIQRIVRQNFGRFRLCYENGLRTNPNLQGRVSTKFVIDTQGAVTSSQNAGSDLPDAGVVACVVRSFASMSFPQPDSGIVTVVYPVSFSPGDAAPPAASAAPAPKKK